MSNNKTLETFKQVFLTEIEGLHATASELFASDAVVQAVHAMSTCNKIVVTGLGKSGLVGRKISATLTSIGSPSIFIHPVEGVHGDLGIVNNGDVVLAISNSGSSVEVINLLEVLRRIDITVIGITACKNSRLASLCDIVLAITVPKEACIIGKVPTTSTTITMVVGDALAMGVATEKKFDAKSFAAFHPGGIIGKRLTLKSKDIMHAGDRLPLMKPTDSFVDVVSVVTSKRLGHAIVGNDKDELLGIISDGDLRRVMKVKGGNFSELDASDIMSTKPTIVGPETLIEMALDTMQRLKITAIVVVENSKIVGLIHIHDILAAGFN